MSTIQKYILPVGMIIVLVVVTLITSSFFTVRAQDPSIPKIESDDPAVMRTGPWSNQPSAQASGGGYLYNAPSPINGDDVALSFQFSGPTIEILYVSGPNLGTMALEIDGVVLRTVITTAPQTAYQQSATIDYLTDEAHTLRVYAQAGGVIGMDAFILPSLTLPSYSVQVPIQRSPRLASPDCSTSAAVRRMAIPDASIVSPQTYVEFNDVQMSSDGRYIAFTSGYQNLLPDLDYDPTEFPYGYEWQAVYRVNTQTCAIEVISENASGQVVYGKLSGISDDGRFVVFSTLWSLVAADTNTYDDEYIRDMNTGVISLASRNSQGQGGNGRSYFGAISHNGRYIVFASVSTNLDPTDTTDDEDMFVLDLQTGQTTLVPANVTTTNYTQLGKPSISDDGRYVTYSFPATFLMDGQWPRTEVEIFVTDRQTTTTLQVTHSSTLVLYPGKRLPQITADGRYIFFYTAESLVPDDGNYYQGDVYLYDRVTTTLTDLTDGNCQEEGTRQQFDISSDGRYLIFVSGFTCLVEPDTNGNAPDVYMLDRQTGLIRRVSQAFDGGQIDVNDYNTAQVGSISVSDDGRYIAYVSDADNVVPNDDLGWRGYSDIFFADLQATPVHTTLVATLPIARRVDLTWTQHAPTPTQFEIQRSPNGATDWTTLTTTTIGQTSYSDYSVALATMYHYRLQALTPDPNYTLYSTISRITLPALFQHTALVATVPGDDRVDLTWTQYSATPTELEVQRRDDWGNWTSLGIVPVGQTSFTDTTVACNTRYTYRLSVLTPDPDYQPYSNTAQVTTLRCRPPCHPNTYPQLVSLDSWAGYLNMYNNGTSAISADGNYVAFLAFYQSQDHLALYVRNRQTCQTTFASVLPNEAQTAVRGNEIPAISEDGRYVAFVGFFSGYYYPQVYVRDLQANTTRLVTADANGEPIAYNPSQVVMSDDGRYVAFVDEAGRNGLPYTGVSGGHVYVTDLQNGTIVVVPRPLDSGGCSVLYCGGSRDPDISADGRYVVFLDESPTRPQSVYVYDLQTATTITVTGPLQPDDTQRDYYPTISADGRYVAFVSDKDYLIPNDTNERADVFVYDLQTHSTTRVSVTSSGEPLPIETWSGTVSLSGDGRYVAFQSSLGHGLQILIHDRQLAQTYFVSMYDASTPGDSHSWNPQIASNAPVVTFRSYADNLLGGSAPPQGVYVTSIYPPPGQSRPVLWGERVSYGQINLHWTHYSPAPDPAPITYTIERSGDGGTVWDVIHTTIAGDTSYQDAALACGMNYQYRLHLTEPNPQYADFSNVVTMPTTSCDTDTLALINPSTRHIALFDTIADPVPSGAVTTYTLNARASGQWVMGDWDGDGVRTPGVYEASGAFMYTNTLGPTATWTGIWFGLLGRPPIAGHFDATVNHDCLGVMDSAEFPPYGTGYAAYFACDLTSGTMPHLYVQWLGVPYFSDTATHGAIQVVAGDFDGDGVDSFGWRRDSSLIYTNQPPSSLVQGYTNSTGFSTPLLPANDYGLLVLGDWNDDGNDEIGFLSQMGEFAYQSDGPWSTPVFLQHAGTPVGTPVQAFSWR